MGSWLIDGYLLATRYIFWIWNRKVAIGFFVDSFFLYRKGDRFGAQLFDKTVK